MGTDAATIFAAIGVIGLLLELAKEKRSRLNVLCTVPLALSAFFAYQRAVLLTLLAVVVVVVVVVATGSKTARQRLRVAVGRGRRGRPRRRRGGARRGGHPRHHVPEIGHRPALLHHQPPETTLESAGKQESAQDRLNKWDVALADAKQHWFLGQGLGFEYSYFQAGPNQYITTDLTENIGLDLWLRTGLIGLGIFLLALVVSLVSGFATWRMHPDPMVAVFALALFAVVVGMIAKGQVESIFENYRLATLFGISLGMLRCAVTSGGGGPAAMRTYQATRHYEVI